MDQSDQSNPSRRRFFGLARGPLGYAAPAIVALAVPALLVDEAEAADSPMGMMRMMKRMMMKKTMSMPMR